MSIESSSSSSSSLPEDLLIEILLCLPIKTLLRFKSVSKSWLAIIDGSDFVHLHATTTTTVTPDNTFIFQSSRRHVSLNFFSISSSGGHNEFQVLLEDLGMPPCYRDDDDPISCREYWKDDGDLFMVGSCNGVICLQDDKLRDVYLWNPAIHQFRLLPKSLTFAGIGNGKVYKDFIAFGFDVQTKDYKVMLVTYFYPRTTTTTDQVGIDDDYYYKNHPTKYPHGVQVYSLSTDSWRKPLDQEDLVVVMPSHPRPLRAGGGYLNGSYYCLGWKWITSTSSSIGDEAEASTLVMEEVLSFDFTKEIFKTMQLPDGIIKNIVPFRELSIMFLGGKFAIIDHHMPQNTYDFWVLINNEVGGGGVKEEYYWTKLYTIGPYYHTHERPIGISNNGEFIFMVTNSNGGHGGETMWLLNPSTQVMIKDQLRCDVNDDGGNQIMRADVYRGSLVPVCSTS